MKSLKASPLEVTLLASVFVVAACGLVYELAAGALASYLLGDSILQFSTVIGCYLFAMGVGSWLSQFFDRQLPAHFLRIELLVALAGGLLPAALFLANAYIPGSFRWVLYGLVATVGILVGLEIPLVMRILKRNVAFKDVVSQVLTFDYLGALAVSVAFPLILVPQLGLIRTGLLFGLLNAGVAVWALWLFRFELRQFKAHALACGVTLAVLAAAFLGANHITTLAEDKFYQDRIVFTAASPYQRIVVTQGKLGHRLFLNGNLQFAERDEYRYHEALVHPAMAAFSATGPKRVAVLGGGDGMAVREILKYPSVASVTLVELDPAMTRLFSEQPTLVKLNGGALTSPKVKVVNTDAFAWLDSGTDMFDVIIVDFPDPTNFSIGKLYTNSFYALLDQHLAASGYAVIQTTSPLVARRSYWTVVSTLESVGLRTAPYHTNVP
ncbi:MAG: polyamine aminopropyltransferase, partial [Burkholderiaceae bacterium]